MKKFGFGMMRMPRLDANDPAAVDVEQVKKMVDLFMERGFTYFDTAWPYHAHNSENVVRQAVVERHDRGSFTVATKLNCNFFNTEEERDGVFAEQLRKTGAGYFDYYLLHGVDAANRVKFEKLDCFNFILKKKEEGLIRHAGFSFHDKPEVLDEVLTAHPEMEFVQLQLNYLDWDSPWIEAGKCYEVAKAHGVPVIVMEPVKGGTLAKLPEEAERMLRAYDPDRTPAQWAVGFAASLDNVMMVLSGMSNLEQMDENSAFMQDFTPFSEEEMDLCRKAAAIINSEIAVPCTGCSYCTEGCPMNIAIPQYFSIYNEVAREDKVARKDWSVNFNTYRKLCNDFGKASDCIACGQCEGVCPQHLPIIESLKAVAERFGQ